MKTQYENDKQLNRNMGKNYLNSYCTVEETQRYMEKSPAPRDTEEMPAAFSVTIINSEGWQELKAR